METTNEFDQLATWLSEPSRRDLPVLIDGWTNAGKTCLAKKLAEATQSHFLDADSFLSEATGEFISAIDVSTLSEAFFSASRPILSGVCMRELHALLGTPEATHVYIKRIATWGWAEEFEVSEDPSDWTTSGEPPLVTEVRAYHLKWKPHENADVIFERPDYQ